MTYIIKKKLFLISFIPTLLFGQETKKITSKIENSLMKEVYYVLKSDKSIRQGNYQKLGHVDQILINGYYKNGLRDSIWTEYLWSGEKIQSFGNYLKDQKIGVWEFYNNKGELEQKYDFTKNEVIFFKFDDKEKSKEYSVIKDSDTIKTLLDRPPLCIGGSIIMSKTIVDNINYPEIAIVNGVSGKVYVSFTIDNKGNPSNYKIKKGIGSGCDEEALRVVKLIPNNWLPGLINGQVVNVEYILPINFNMQ